MVAQPPDLPAYDEIIASLAAKLEGLSTVHSGLGDAAEYLILAHSEMDATKRQIELLASSTQAMVDEVKHLRPVELAATLDASMASLTRETAESIDALRERVAAVSTEIAADRRQANQTTASLERQLVARFKEMAKSLAALDRSLSDALTDARTALLLSLVETQEPTQKLLAEIHGVVTLSRDDQADLSQVTTGIASEQAQLARRHEEIVPLLAQSEQRQTDLFQQLIVVAGAIAGVQQTVNTNQLTLEAVRRTVEATGPALEASVTAGRHEVVVEIARSKRIQWVSLALVLGAIVLAWASLMGFIPEP